MDWTEAFADWANRVINEFKDRGWSISRVSRESKVGRTILYRWTSGDPDQSKPDRSTVERFCRNLYVPTDEPFAIFGWTEATYVDPGPISPIVDDDVRAIQEVIDRHDLTADEVEEVRAVLRMIRKRFGQKPPNGGGGEAD